MSQRKKIYLLIGLLLILVLVFALQHQNGPAFVSVAADSSTKVVPIGVDDPTLRLDLLDRINKREYTGTHRDIFNATPPPTPRQIAEAHKRAAQPPAPTGPPPLVVPATFFGYEMDALSGKRQAFFTNGDDVFIVDEGGILLNRFRLLKIGNNSADVEELASGRRTTVNMEQPGVPGQPSPQAAESGGPPISE